MKHPSHADYDIHPRFARASAVLFDFDFTLADSSRGVVACFNHALFRLGLPGASADTIRRTIGLELAAALATVAGEEWRPRAEEFARHFLRKADEVMVEATFLLPGAVRVLGGLHAAGYRLGIVSTKHRRRISSVLRRDGLATVVEVVVGGDDVRRSKPDPEGLLKAAAVLGLPVGRCIYVGDSVVDARAAQAAGMRFGAVLSGPTPREALLAHSVHAVLAGVGEIVPDTG